MHGNYHTYDHTVLYARKLPYIRSYSTSCTAVTIYTIIYDTYLRLWQTLVMQDVHAAQTWSGIFKGSLGAKKNSVGLL